MEDFNFFLINKVDLGCSYNRMAQIKAGGKNASMHLTEKHLVSWLYGVVVFQPLDSIQWLEINSTPPLFCRAILVGKEGEKARVIARVSGLL